MGELSPHAKTLAARFVDVLWSDVPVKRLIYLAARRAWEANGTGLWHAKNCGRRRCLTCARTLMVAVFGEVQPGAAEATE